jgi:hypothetical protein
MQMLYQKLTPVGVYELKVADLRSRDIFFVALCRANGLLRLQPETMMPQYWYNKWENVVLKQNLLLAKWIYNIKESI